MSQLHEESKLPSIPERKSGRAVFDDGHTVWEWQTATGVFERYVSDEQLARLEAANLRLVEPSHMDTGRVMYGAAAARKAYATRKQVFVARPAIPVREAHFEPLSMLRQLWRRFIPST